MTIRILMLSLLVLLVSCTNQAKEKNIEEIELDNSKKEVTNNDLLFESNCIILYIPDSLNLEALEREKSQEELMSIEYDKTLAMEFLENKDIPTRIEDSRKYLFKKSNGEVIKIEVDLYSSWGIILFKPEKDPKVIFLNDITYEYDSYFSNMK